VTLNLGIKARVNASAEKYSCHEISQKVDCHIFFLLFFFGGGELDGVPKAPGKDVGSMTDTTILHKAVHHWNTNVSTKRVNILPCEYCPSKFLE